jgi:hypothetical protein
MLRDISLRHSPKRVESKTYLETFLFYGHLGITIQVPNISSPFVAWGSVMIFDTPLWFPYVCYTPTHPCLCNSNNIHLVLVNLALEI